MGHIHAGLWPGEAVQKQVVFQATGHFDWRVAARCVRACVYEYGVGQMRAGMAAGSDRGHALAYRITVCLTCVPCVLCHGHSTHGSRLGGSPSRAYFAAWPGTEAFANAQHDRTVELRRVVAYGPGVVTARLSKCCFAKRTFCRNSRRRCAEFDVDALIVGGAA